MSGKIPLRFVWALINNNADEPLENIIRRKNLERESGQCEQKNVFWWGIGANKGPAIFIHLADQIPEILFSKGLRKAARNGAERGQCFLWTTYHTYDEKQNDYGGESTPVPSNVIVISEDKYRQGNYALVCRSSQTLKLAGPNLVYRRKMQNLNKDETLGETLERSQQTISVVEYSQGKNTSEDAYPIEMRANLAPPCFVKLGGAIKLKDSQRRLVEEVGGGGKTVDDYLYVAWKIRE